MDNNCYIRISYTKWEGKMLEDPLQKGIVNNQISFTKWEGKIFEYLWQNGRVKFSNFL